MQLVGTEDAAWGPREQVPRGQQHGTVLPAAQPAVRTHQSLEGGDVEGVLVDEAVDVEVRCRLHGDGPAQHSACVLTEGCERVLALDRTGA